MRLFFAIALDEPLRRAAADAAETLQRRLAEARNARAVKWVERENLHVTMRFLGEVDDVRARSMIAWAQDPLSAASFDLGVGGAGAFPPSGAPRVLWIGIGQGGDEARAAFDRLEERIASLGFEPEARAYTPHLTLGRVREIDHTHGRALREWLADIPASLGRQHVTHVTLYRSHLSPRGPRYEIASEVPLS